VALADYSGTRGAITNASRSLERIPDTFLELMYHSDAVFHFGTQCDILQ